MKDPENDDRGKHFAQSSHILYHILIYQKKYPLQEVAEKVNISPSTLYKYCQGIYACPVEVLKRIFETTQAIELLELLKPKGYDFVSAKKDTSHLKPTFEAEVNDDYVAVTRVVEAYRKAKKDGKIDAREKEILNRLIDIAKCELEETRQVIRLEMKGRKK